MTFHSLPNKTRFKLRTAEPLLKDLVCIKVDHQRFAELTCDNYKLNDEIVRVCYGDFEVITLDLHPTSVNREQELF